MMLSFKPLRCLAVLTLCLVADVARADDPEQTNSLPAPTQEDLSSVEAALARSKEHQAALQAAQAAALQEQEEMSNRLVAMAQTAAEQEKALAKAEKRLKTLSAELSKSGSALAARRDELSKLLAGLQRLEQDPPPALVVNPDDVLQALRGAMMFSAVVPELRAKADALKADLKLMTDLKASLDQETRDRALALQALQQSRTEITALIAEKQAAAEAADKDLATERKTAEALALKASSLRDLLAKLEEARLKAEAQKAAEAADAKAKAEAAANPPSMAFARAKGQLNLPVQGTAVKNFGDDTGLGHALPGLALKTEANAHVTAPVSGKVEFAGKFRSYDGLVIINPGDGYLVLLAGMEKILTATGQSVKAGEPLGEMGLKSAELAISNDLTNQDFPVLYVEFRKDSNPIDPSPWWVSNSQEAKK